jgi:hypothetical protein
MLKMNMTLEFVNIHEYQSFSFPWEELQGTSTSTSDQRYQFINNSLHTIREGICQRSIHFVKNFTNWSKFILLSTYFYCDFVVKSYLWKSLESDPAHVSYINKSSGSILP